MPFSKANSTNFADSLYVESSIKVISRYLIRQQIDTNDKRQIYAAYDPELNRSVAIELLIGGGSAHQHLDNKRLLASAQALAGISHPSVVHIYEVGFFKNQIYLVMDLINGQTLKQWSSQRRRTWRDIAKIMAEASRGLACAHRAGVAHGNICQENIQITDEGRVVICGFVFNRSALTGLHLNKSQKIALKEIKHDQYQFFLTLSELVKSKSAQNSFSTKKESIHLPAGVNKFIRKGLSAKSEAGFESLEEVSTILLSSSRDKFLAGAILLAVVMGIAIISLLFYKSTSASHQFCQGTEKKLAGIWDASSRQKLQRAFMTTNKSYAKYTFETVSKRLDTYTNKWVQIFQQACLATNQYKSQSAELLDLRMYCLNRKLQKLSTLIEVFILHSDQQVLDKASQAVYSLGDLEHCSNQKRLTTRMHLPEDPLQEEKVTQLRKQLDRVESLIESGKYDEAVILGQQTQGQAQALDYQPTQAESLFLLGKALRANGNYRKAENLQRSAILKASKSKYHEIAGKAWVELTNDIVRQAEYKRALLYRLPAYLGLSRSQSKAEEIGSAFKIFATLFYRQGNYPRAERLLKRSLKLSQSALGINHPNIASVLNSLAALYDQKGQYKKAEPLYKKALFIWEKSLGQDHPDIGMPINNLAILYYNLGELEKAEILYKQALKIWENALGKEHPRLVPALFNLANLYRERNLLGKAESLSKRALGVSQKTLGQNHSNVAWPLNNLGLIYMNKKQFALAQKNFKRALNIWENTLGDQHSNVAMILNNLGELHLRQNKINLAAKHFHRALVIREKTLSKTHPWLVFSLIGLGSTSLHKGATIQALAEFKRAYLICQEQTCSEINIALTKWGLARSLGALKKDRNRSISLAKQALEFFKDNQTVLDRQQLEEIKAFIKIM